jgi:hypothetical protein
VLWKDFKGHGTGITTHIREAANTALAGTLAPAIRAIWKSVV